MTSFENLSSMHLKVYRTYSPVRFRAFSGSPYLFRRIHVAGGKGMNACGGEFVALTQTTIVKDMEFRQWQSQSRNGKAKKFESIYLLLFGLIHRVVSV